MSFLWSKGGESQSPLDDGGPMEVLHSMVLHEQQARRRQLSELAVACLSALEPGDDLPEDQSAQEPQFVDVPVPGAEAPDLDGVQASARALRQLVLQLRSETKALIKESEEKLQAQVERQISEALLVAVGKRKESLDARPTRMPAEANSRTSKRSPQRNSMVWAPKSDLRSAVSRYGHTVTVRGATKSSPSGGPELETGSSPPGKPLSTPAVQSVAQLAAEAAAARQSPVAQPVVQPEVVPEAQPAGQLEAADAVSEADNSVSAGKSLPDQQTVNDEVGSPGVPQGLPEEARFRHLQRRRSDVRPQDRLHLAGGVAGAPLVIPAAHTMVMEPGSAASSDGGYSPRSSPSVPHRGASAFTEESGRRLQRRRSDFRPEDRLKLQGGAVGEPVNMAFANTMAATLPAGLPNFSAPCSAASSDGGASPSFPPRKSSGLSEAQARHLQRRRSDVRPADRLHLAGSVAGDSVGSAASENGTESPIFPNPLDTSGVPRRASVGLTEAQARHLQRRRSDVRPYERLHLAGGEAIAASVSSACTGESNGTESPTYQNQLDTANMSSGRASAGLTQAQARHLQRRRSDVRPQDRLHLAGGVTDMSVADDPSLLASPVNCSAGSASRASPAAIEETSYVIATGDGQSRHSSPATSVSGQSSPDFYRPGSQMEFCRNQFYGQQLQNAGADDESPVASGRNSPNAGGSTRRSRDQGHGDTGRGRLNSPILLEAPQGRLVRPPPASMVSSRSQSTESTRSRMGRSIGVRGTQRHPLRKVTTPTRGRGF